MTDSPILNDIVTLSREFGTDAFVRGGGGNTSCKNAETLYIKPSGTRLPEMTADTFLPLSRAKLNTLYGTKFSANETEREREVVAFMAGTVGPGAKGRPSVEAPLHDSFPQRFVVHTHPALVGGLVCGQNGPEVSARLFPDALWMPPIEPGYTLCMKVREEMQRFAAERGRPAELLFLQNHGVFIAHDEADGIRALFKRVMTALQGEVDAKGIVAMPFQPTRITGDSGLIADIQKVMGEDAASFVAAAPFAVPVGALTPDHIVYCRTEMYSGDASEQSLGQFRSKTGYWPRVVSTPAAVYGFGPTAKVAELALELAWDGAMVVNFARAFGGVSYLDKRLVDFIANWEVESYRQKVSR